MAVAHDWCGCPNGQGVSLICNLGETEALLARQRFRTWPIHFSTPMLHSNFTPIPGFIRLRMRVFLFSVDLYCTA